MVDVAIVLTLILISLLAIVINLICIVVIYITPSLHRPSNIAIATLLFIHIIQGVLVIPSYVVKRWRIQDIKITGPICDLFRFSYMITNYCSCITLLIISIDRLIAIKWPLKYHFYVSTKRIGVTVLSSWLYIIILCCIPFIPSKRSGEGCTYRQQKLWSTTMLIVNTLLPFVAICYCYAYIFTKARLIFQQRMSRTFALETQKYKANKSKLLRKSATRKVTKHDATVDSENKTIRDVSRIRYEMRMQGYEISAKERTKNVTYADSEIEDATTNSEKKIRNINRTIHEIQNDEIRAVDITIVEKNGEILGERQVPDASIELDCERKDSRDMSSLSERVVVADGVENIETDTKTMCYDIEIKNIQDDLNVEDRVGIEKYNPGKLKYKIENHENIHEDTRKETKAYETLNSQPQLKEMHQTADSPPKRRSGIFAEIIAARMSLIVVFAYFLCWGPSFMYYFLMSICSSCYPDTFWDSQAEEILGFVIKLLTFLNALAAPLIYCWKHRSIQTGIKRLMRKLFHMKQPSYATNSSNIYDMSTA